MAGFSPEEQRQVDRYNDNINKEIREDFAKTLGLVGVPFIAELATFASGAFGPSAMVRQLATEEHLYSPALTSSYDFTDEFKKQILDAFNDASAAYDDVDSIKRLNTLGLLFVLTAVAAVPALFLDELSEAYGEDALPNAVRHLANTYGGPVPERLLSEETIQELWKKPDLYEGLYEDGTISHGLYQRFKGKTEPEEAPLVASAPQAAHDFVTPRAVAQAMMQDHATGMPSGSAIEQALAAVEGVPSLQQAEPATSSLPEAPPTEEFTTDQILLENVR